MTTNNQLAVIEKEVYSNARSMVAVQLGKEVKDPEVAKFLAGAMMTIAGDWKLSQCTPKSIGDCLVEAAQAKLPVDSRRLAYLIPYGKTATLMPSYQGYVHILSMADPTTIVVTNLVFNNEADSLSIETDGVTETIKHKRRPQDLEEKWGNLHGAYTIVKDSKGQTVTYLTKKQIITSKSSSKVNMSDPETIWRKYPVEMIKKTVIINACKVRKTSAVATLNNIEYNHHGFNKNTVQATAEPINYTEEVSMPDVVDVEHTEPVEEPKPKPTPKPKAKAEAKDERIDDLQGDILTMQGYIEKVVERKGRGPWKVVIEGGWYNTFDSEIADLAKENEACEVTITYTTKKTVKNGTEYVNLDIESLRPVQQSSAPEEEAISDDEPYTDEAEIAGDLL